MARKRVHNPNVSWVEHLQISWGGTLGTGTKEIWANGMRMVFGGGFVPTPAQLDSYLAPIQTAVSTWVGSNSNNQGGHAFISSEAHLTWVKANYILASGLQRDQSTHVLDFAAVNGGNPANCPWYQTLAVTMRSAVNRGRTHAGRIYPPLVALGPDVNTGYFATADVNLFNDAAGNLIQDLNTTISQAAPGIGRISNLSPGDSTKGTVPLFAHVTHVTTDRVPDVQHRRTNRLQRSEVAPVIIPA